MRRLATQDFRGDQISWGSMVGRR